MYKHVKGKYFSVVFTHATYPSHEHTKDTLNKHRY